MEVARPHVRIQVESTVIDGSCDASDDPEESESRPVRVEEERNEERARQFHQEELSKAGIPSAGSNHVNDGHVMTLRRTYSQMQGR